MPAMASILQAPGLPVDPLLPSVVRQAQARYSLTLPWMSKGMRLGTCFHSALAHTDAPFSSSSQLFAAACTGEYRPSGAQGSFRSIDSSSAGASSEHLSAALSVSTGCPILSATATGQYDRDVLSNQDDCKTSVSASYRCGSVSLAAPPRLTDAALLTLKYGGGLDAFKKRYGDYYVATYMLGADAGALVSRNSRSTSEAERLAITVQLKVALWTASHSEAKSWKKESSSSSTTVSAFSTLGSLHIRETVDTGGSELQRLAAKANEILASIDSVPTRVETMLSKLGVRAGEALPGETCDGLCESGLVVELILLPIETLHEVQRWATSTDII